MNTCDGAGFWRSTCCALSNYLRLRCRWPRPLASHTVVPASSTRSTLPVCSVISRRSEAIFLPTSGSFSAPRIFTSVLNAFATWLRLVPTFASLRPTSEGSKSGHHANCTQPSPSWYWQRPTHRISLRMGFKACPYTQLLPHPPPRVGGGGYGTPLPTPPPPPPPPRILKQAHMLNTLHKIPDPGKAKPEGFDAGLSIALAAQEAAEHGDLP